MWYNSAIAFMLVEVNARSYSQMVVMCFIYIINAVVNAVLFGVFVEQFQVIRRKKNEYQEKIDTSNKIMYELGMLKKPLTIGEEVRTYFKKINETKYELDS